MLTSLTFQPYSCDHAAMNGMTVFGEFVLLHGINVSGEREHGVMCPNP